MDMPPSRNLQENDALLLLQYFSVHSNQRLYGLSDPLKVFSDPLNSFVIILKIKTVWCLRHVLLHNITDV